jgi:hypothetical protein
MLSPADATEFLHPIDRQRLGHLNAIEKLNCIYCGYANGVIAFAREVARRTEQYWCPIKHATPPAAANNHYREFLVMVTHTVGQNFRLMVPLTARGGRLRAAVSARAIKDDTNGQYF